MKVEDTLRFKKKRVRERERMKEKEKRKRIRKGRKIQAISFFLPVWGVFPFLHRN